MTAAQWRMPVLDLLPLAYFVNGEGGAAKKKLTTMAWDKKMIYAEEIAVIVPISEAVLDDAEYDIWGEVRPRLVEAFGAKIDGAILFGQDKPATWRDDVITTATKAGAAVTLGADLYDSILGENGVIAKVEESGYFVSGHIADITMRAKLRGLKDTTGQPVFKSDMQAGTSYTLDGSPMNFPRNGAFDKAKALMISGDFSQLAYSIRQDITFKIFDQGVIQDPATGDILYRPGRKKAPLVAVPGFVPRLAGNGIVQPDYGLPRHGDTGQDAQGKEKVLPAHEAPVQTAGTAWT